MQTRIVAVPLFASLFAGLVIMSGGGAARGDECLANPKGPTPAGGHWYYHLDRATKRTCWFLRDDGAASAKEAVAGSTARAQESSAAPAAPAAPAAATAATPPDQAVAPSSADARAELAAPRARKDAAAKPKPAAAKPVAAKADATPPETTMAGADPAVGEGAGERAALLKVSDAEALADGAAPAPTAPPSATPNALPSAPSTALPSAIPNVTPSALPDPTPNAASPAAEAPRENAAAQVAETAPAPVERAIGPLRMFLGLGLIGGGLSVMLACLVFHLMYGTITFPQQSEAGQLTDLL